MSGRSLLLAVAAALLLAVTLVAPVHAANVNPYGLSPRYWTNSVYSDIYAYVSQPAPADSGIRLSLDCGPAVAVTPPNGFCLELQQSSYKFTMRTFAETADANCSFTLHQGESTFYDPLSPQSAAPRPVRQQRTLTVSPSSSAQSPIVVGRNAVAALSFAPSEDLVSTQQINIQCSNLAVASAIVTGVQLVADPRVGTVTMGDSLGFVACSFSSQDSEVDTAGWAFFQIVESAQLAATGIPLAASVVAGDLPAAVTAGATFTLSVAPPSTPKAFDLTLTCALTTGAAPIVATATFTAETTAAQTLSIVTPADAAGMVATCTWTGTGAVIDAKTVLPPPPFSFYTGADLAVITAAVPTQLTADTPTSVITVSVPDGTVFANSLRVSVQCSAGSLSWSTLTLQNGQLSATTTYTAAPTAAASAPQCTFTLQSLGDYRRVKAAIAPVAFSVAAAVVKQQLVVKGLPTAADVIAVTAVPGIVSQAAATAGIPITLSAPTGMAAGSSITGGLSCSASFGAVVAVTPAQRTFTPESTGPAEFVVNVTAPTEPNALSTLVECNWEVDRAASTQSEVDRLDAPQNFNFFVGRAVQLVAVADPDSYPFDYVPASNRVNMAVQSAANEAALVGGSFRLAVACSPCAGAGEQTGEGYFSNRVYGVNSGPFPQEDPARPQFSAWAPGTVTCHWTFPAEYPWSRAFLAPVPTVFTVVPRARLPVMGLPTAADTIPLTWQTNVFPGFRQPGEQVTISMPAVPVDFSFGPTWVNISLHCMDWAARFDYGTRFDYSASSRGARSHTLTMPNATDDRPVHIECHFESEGLAPLEVIDDWTYGYPNFQLMVAKSWASVTVQEPSASALIGGDSVNVWIEPSRTVTMPDTRLAIQVKCAFSAPLPSGLNFNVQSASSLGRRSVQVSNRERLEFLIMTNSYSATLTANTTDAALRLGYTLIAPVAPVTVICTHSMVESSSEAGGYADRFLRLAPTQPMVLTVLPQLAITVTGVPTETLAATPAEQTITVQPILRSGADFVAGETVVLALSCNGLPLANNQLTFTGTGEATVVAQSIMFTPPAVAAGASNVWQCSWSKAGTAGGRFPLPAPFQVAVGSPVTWSYAREKPADSIYPNSANVFKGVLTPSGCLPAWGYVRSECDEGVYINFVSSGWEGASFTDENYYTPATAFPFWIRPYRAGTFTCRFSIDVEVSGTGILPPAPITFTVLPRASFIVTGQPAPEVPLVLAGGASSTIAIAPSVAPGTGGVTMRLVCDDDRATTNPPRLYFPAGLVAAQSLVLSVPHDAYIRTWCGWRPQEPSGDCGGANYGCDWSSYDRSHFDTPEPFQLFTGELKAITVGGLNAQGSVTSADLCGELSFTVAPTVAPAAGTSVVLRVGCPQLGTQYFTFTAEMPQAQTATFKGRGTILSQECSVYEQQGRYVQQTVQVQFGTPIAISFSLPTFVARGAVVPVEISSAVAVPYGDFYVSFNPSCTYGWMSPYSFAVPSGGSSVSASYRATNDAPPENHNEDMVVDAKTPQPLSVDEKAAVAAADSEDLHSLNKESRRKQKRAQRQPASRAAVAIAVVVADPRPSEETTGDQVVTCTWNLRDSVRQRYSMARTSTFIVGTPANLTVTSTAAPTAVAQGASASLTVTPSAAVAVDVEVNVVCPAGVSASPTTFTLLAGAATGQLITLAAAADAQLGAAECTLTTTGPGRMALTTASPIVLNVVDPSMGSASSSSTGKGPCVDAECSAFASASLPSLAALAAMLLATFAQRQ